ncbi:MAG: DUF6152 family protein [Gammaproteobacteria bacterium]
MSLQKMLIIWAVILVPASLGAHHSHSNLDRNNVQKHTGVVSQYGWAMPHVFLKVMSPNLQGEIVEYIIEMNHPPGMQQIGWDKDTFKPGDVITWEGSSDKDPSRYYSGLSWVEKVDGSHVARDQKDTAVQPSYDLTGLWKRDLRGVRPHYEPPKDWPYTPFARALIDGFNESQNPQVGCKDPGPPKYMLLPYPIQISRPNDKTIVIAGELRTEPRVVYLDQAEPPEESSALGYSVGWFEGAELVIETTNFVADKWGIHTGVDSSDQKHLVERYSLSEGGMALDILITVSDPVYLEEAVVFEHHMTKIADRQLSSVPCSLESARLYLEGGYQRE